MALLESMAACKEGDLDLRLADRIAVPGERREAVYRARFAPMPTMECGQCIQ